MKLFNFHVELLYNLEVAKDVGSIFKVINENYKSGLSLKFVKESLIPSIIKQSRQEGRHTYLILPMVYHFWPLAFDLDSSNALLREATKEPMQYDSIFMLCALKDITSSVRQPAGANTRRKFIETWIGENPYLDVNNYIPFLADYSHDDINNALE